MGRLFPLFLSLPWWSFVLLTVAIFLCAFATDPRIALVLASIAVPLLLLLRLVLTAVRVVSSHDTDKDA